MSPRGSPPVGKSVRIDFGNRNPYQQDPTRFPSAILNFPNFLFKAGYLTVKPYPVNTSLAVSTTAANSRSSQHRNQRKLSVFAAWRAKQVTIPVTGRIADAFDARF